jgi:hypothetical protein
MVLQSKTTRSNAHLPLTVEVGALEVVVAPPHVLCVDAEERMRQGTRLGGPGGRRNERQRQHDDRDETSETHPG